MWPAKWPVVAKKQSRLVCVCRPGWWPDGVNEWISLASRILYSTLAAGGRTVSGITWEGLGRYVLDELLGLDGAGPQRESQ